MNLGVLAAFMSSVTWAVGSSEYSLLGERYPTFSVHLARASVAFPMFVLISLLSAHGFTEFMHVISLYSWQRIGWFGVSAIASYAIGDTVFLLSTLSLGVPSALAIASTYPLWSALAGWLLRGEVMTMGKLAGVLLTVLGTVVVILSGYRWARPPGDDGILKRYPVGVMLAFLTSLFWALNAYAVSVGSDGMPALFSNVFRMGFALVLCPLFGMLAFRGKLKLIPRPDYLRSLWVFLFEGFGGAFVFTYGLANAPLAIAAPLSSLAPVLSVPIAWGRRKEPVAFAKAFGVALVVAGVWLLVR